jgi:hypothetical protein
VEKVHSMVKTTAHAARVAQAVEHLPGKHEVLSSNSHATNKTKQNKKKNTTICLLHY